MYRYAEFKVQNSNPQLRGLYQHSKPAFQIVSLFFPGLLDGCDRHCNVSLSKAADIMTALEEL